MPASEALLRVEVIKANELLSRCLDSECALVQILDTVAVLAGLRAHVRSGRRLVGLDPDEALVGLQLTQNAERDRVQGNLYHLGTIPYKSGATVPIYPL